MKKRYMKFDNENDNNDTKPDYFDGEDLPDPVKEKRVRYPEDDPRYWDDDDTQWDHLRGLRKWKLWAYIGGALLIILIFIACWIRYMRPYATGGVQYGYVEQIEERGAIFHTFEGTLLPYRNLMDTTRPYGHDFIFTAADDKIAADLKRASLANKPVKIEFKQYMATVPWRGDSRILVTRVDTVNPMNIMPPDRYPFPKQ